MDRKIVYTRNLSLKVYAYEGVREILVGKA